MLASPATGSIERVWFAPNGSALFARTALGKTFQTTDYQDWASASAPADPPEIPPATALRLPETNARLVSAGDRIYALGKNLWRSADGGRSWENLTAYRTQSIVGDGLHSVAVSPSNPDQIVAGSNYGVWMSMDGGLSWTGLNERLPNLSVERILASPAGKNGTRVVLAKLGPAELPPGSSVWVPSTAPELEKEAALRFQYSALVHAQVTALASSGETAYVGSDDGRIWVSIDGGRTFRQTPLPAGVTGRVERFFVDSAVPRVALAALSGTGAHILRTTNTGVFWDSLDGNLPDTPVRAVTADRASGSIYLATAQGVFYGQADLENASADRVTWTNLTLGYPSIGATDVLLDPAGVQLYVALEGYGVLAAAAPHRPRSLRILNTADLSARPAAPGSLLSVIGARVSGAQGAGLEYPVLAVLGGDSQIQVPFEAAGPTVALALRTVNGTVTQGIAVQPVSPAILVGSDGLPTIYDGDSGEPIDLHKGARSGGRIQIMATGLGRVRPDWPSGQPAPLADPPAVLADVRAVLDGSPLRVTRATLAPGYVGFYIVEAEMPVINNLGTSELYLAAGGSESNKVQILVEP